MVMNMHRKINLKAYYFGTPVVLISSLNEDGSTNLAPMSSAWWLGDYGMLGMSIRSKTVENLYQNPECVLNLPDPSLVHHVNRLALTTGKNPVPKYKEEMGYTFEPEKFSIAGLTGVHSDLVRPIRVNECPVQLECEVEKVTPLSVNNPYLASIVVKVLKAHVSEEIIVPGTRNYIDTDKWSPLIMNFCEYYALNQKKLQKSTLSEAWEPILNS